MSFDWIASHYDWLETQFSDGLMQQCRIAFLSRTQNCRRALLVGEGTGKFLVELLDGNSQVEVVCIEQCAGMIERIRHRLLTRKLDPSRVTFQQMDALEWAPSAEQFDLVVTHFFLDCFRPSQLQALVSQLAKSATADAIWLLADFRVPEPVWSHWRAKAILVALYAFFKVTTGLSANWLTPPAPYLAAAGFTLLERRTLDHGLVHSDLWQRDLRAG